MQHSTTIPTRGATIALQAETALLWLILRRLLGAALLLAALGAVLLPWPIELWAVIMRLGAVVGCVVLAVPLLDPVHDIAGEDFLLDLRAGQLLYRRHLHSGHVRVLRRVPLGLVGDIALDHGYCSVLDLQGESILRRAPCAARWASFARTAPARRRAIGKDGLSPVRCGSSMGKLVHFQTGYVGFCAIEKTGFVHDL